MEWNNLLNFSKLTCTLNGRQVEKTNKVLPQNIEKKAKQFKL